MTQPLPGSSLAAILNTEKALGTRLVDLVYFTVITDVQSGIPTNNNVLNELSIKWKLDFILQYSK